LQQEVTSGNTTPAGEAAARRAAGGQTDDLLSQLAGEEIDRMLAEADAAPGESPPVADADVELSQAIDGAVAAAAPAATTTAAASPDEQISRQLDDVLSAITARTAPTESASAPEPAAAPTLPAAHAVAVADLPAPAVSATGQHEPTHSPPAAAQLQTPGAPAATASVQPAESPADEQHTTRQELAALNAPQEQAQPQVQPKAATADESQPQPRDPLYIRLLELINAPLKLFPDTVRDALGKVAILTLMNAVGVLLYVLLFRK
jgi:hypothetical protein